jgi:hypothetical protein
VLFAAVCVSLGMQGQCCPTPEGIMLGCCEAQQLGSKLMLDEWKALLFCDLAGTTQLRNLMT